MILKHFFDISTGFRYKKMDTSSPSMYRDVHALEQTNKQQEFQILDLEYTCRLNFI